MHLSQDHHEDIEEGEVKFSNFSAFEAWKEEEERMTGSLFVQKCAPQQYTSTRVWYFYCNRAGVYVPKGTGLRRKAHQK